MRILSFDVGIRHLAYCSVDTATGKVADMQIQEWDIIDLEKVQSVDACCRKLVEQLHRRFAFPKFDVVLIERQPKHRSIMMVAIQMFLCTYFYTARIVTGNPRGNVRFMHASLKLECEQEIRSAPPQTGPTPEGAQNVGSQTSGSQTTHNKPGKWQGRWKRSSSLDKKAAAARYKDNKRRAVETCRHYLEFIIQDFANLALLEQYTKKDDLCDAFLQAVAHVEGNKYKGRD